MAVEEGQSMWPTPQVDDAKNVYPKENRRETLVSRVNKWPTPNASSGGTHTGISEETARSEAEKGNQIGLGAAAAMWPTPSSMPRGAHSGREHDGLQTVSKTTGTKFGMTLETAIKHWPTAPANEDATRSSIGTLNPQWVCWLMGLPVGWVSLDPLPEEAYVEWIEGMMDGTWWDTEKGLPRITPSVPGRVNMLKALGNGIVPQCIAKFTEDRND